MAVDSREAVEGRDDGFVALKYDATIPILNIALTGHIVDEFANIPVMNGLPVRGLIDMDGDTIVVRQLLVPKEKMADTASAVLLLDGTVHVSLRAMVDLDTPLFSGIVRATSMQDPLYDVVLGNIQGVGIRSRQVCG